jgi:AcrR family transcriptional regulator
VPPLDETNVRRRILDTTRHLLISEGYTGLSMRKIARAVGFSATSLYLYFENKDALFHALIDEGMAQLYVAMEAAAARHPGDPERRLRALCEAYVAFGLDHPETYEIMFVLHPTKTARYPVDDYRRARRSLDLIGEALAEGAAPGARAEPRLSASVAWAMLHGIVALLLARRLDAGIAPEAFIDVAIQHTLRGLALREGAAAVAV